MADNDNTQQPWWRQGPDPESATVAPGTMEREEMPGYGAMDRGSTTLNGGGSRTVSVAGGPDNPKSGRDVVARGVVNVANPGGYKALGEAGKTSESSGNKPERQDATALSPEEQEDRDAVIGLDEQISTLERVAKEKKPESEEDRRKRERRERSKKIIAAVSNGLSALSNLYFTTQYAPNMYNKDNSSLGRVNERIEKLKAERKADEDYYNNVMLKIGELRNAKAATLRELKAKRLAQELARKKDAREEDLHPLIKAVQEAKGDKERRLAQKALNEAIEAGVVAKYAPQREEAKIETEKSKKRNYDASATAHYASANASNASAGKYRAETQKINDGDGFYVTDADGNRRFISDYCCPIKIFEDIKI